MRLARNEAIAIATAIRIAIIVILLLFITFKSKAAVHCNINFSFIPVPIGPPLNFTAQNASSTSINVTWKPIAENLQRGVILGYRITFKKQHEASRRKRRSIHDVVLVEKGFTRILEGLEKFTNYCVKIVGFNSKGNGNFSDWLCVSTDEDGKHFYTPKGLNYLGGLSVPEHVWESISITLIEIYRCQILCNSMKIKQNHNYDLDHDHGHDLGTRTVIAVQKNTMQHPSGSLTLWSHSV